VSILTSVIRHDVKYSRNKTLDDRPSSVDFGGGDTYFGWSKIQSEKNLSHYNFCQETRNVFIFTAVIRHDVKKNNTLDGKPSSVQSLFVYDIDQPTF